MQIFSRNLNSLFFLLLPPQNAALAPLQRHKAMLRATSTCCTEMQSNPYPPQPKQERTRCHPSPAAVHRAGGQTAPVLGQWGIFGQWDVQGCLNIQKDLQLSEGEGPPCSRGPPTRSLARRHCPGQLHCRFFAGTWTRWTRSRRHKPCRNSAGGMSTHQECQALGSYVSLVFKMARCAPLHSKSPLWWSAWKVRGGKI